MPLLRCVQEVYEDPQQLWQRAKGNDGSHKEWYQGAVSYWDRQEASYDGVLGGFGYVSDYDISDSKALLQRVRQHMTSSMLCTATHKQQGNSTAIGPVHSMGAPAAAAALW